MNSKCNNHNNNNRQDNNNTLNNTYNNNSSSCILGLDHLKTSMTKSNNLKCREDRDRKIYHLRNFADRKFKSVCMERN